MKSVKP